MGEKSNAEGVADVVSDLQQQQEENKRKIHQANLSAGVRYISPDNQIAVTPEVIDALKNGTMWLDDRGILHLSIQDPKPKK